MAVPDGRGSRNGTRSTNRTLSVPAVYGSSAAPVLALSSPAVNARRRPRCQFALRRAWATGSDSGCGAIAGNKHRAGPVYSGSEISSTVTCTQKPPGSCVLRSGPASPEGQNAKILLQIPSESDSLLVLAKLPNLALPLLAKVDDSGAVPRNAAKYLLEPYAGSSSCLPNNTEYTCRYM